MWKEVEHEFLKDVHKHKTAATILIFLGAFTVIKTGWRILKGVWTTFLRPSRDLFKRYKGGYVVVTGATNGLGYEYARQFAQKGFGLILISRDQDKLERVKKEIQEINSKIDIITITFDFNIPYTEEGYKKLKDKLLELKDVSVLVNNVGALYNAPYAEMKMCDINTMIQVNCIPQSFMTNILLPSMLKRSKDEGKRCAIINISSAAHHTRLVNSGIYSATKSFNYTLSEVIRKEVGDYIDVMAVLPGPVFTNMIRFKGALVITPEQHVRWTLSDLGYNNETFGHYLHIINCHALSFRLYAYIYIQMKLKQQREAEQNK